MHPPFVLYMYADAFFSFFSGKMMAVAAAEHNGHLIFLPPPKKYFLLPAVEMMLFQAEIRFEMMFFFSKKRKFLEITLNLTHIRPPRKYIHPSCRGGLLLLLLLLLFFPRVEKGVWFMDQTILEGGGGRRNTSQQVFSLLLLLLLLLGWVLGWQQRKKVWNAPICSNKININVRIFINVICGKTSLLI